MLLVRKTLSTRPGKQNQWIGPSQKYQIWELGGRAVIVPPEIMRGHATRTIHNRCVSLWRWGAKPVTITQVKKALKDLMEDMAHMQKARQFSSIWSPLQKWGAHAKHSVILHWSEESVLYLTYLTKRNVKLRILGILTSVNIWWNIAYIVLKDAAHSLCSNAATERTGLI